MKPKKNILILYPGFPHYRDGIIEELHNEGRHHYIFAGDKIGYNNILPYEFDDEIEFYNLPAYRIGKFNFNKGLFKLIFSQKFDGAIVHASPYWISIIIASITFRIRGIKVYNWGHGLLTDFKSLKNKLYVTFFKLCFDGVILYGNVAKKNLISFGFKEQNIKVIYNSLNHKEQIKFRGTISEESRKELRAKLFQYPGNFQLVFIGRLTSQKKLHHLINVINDLINENVGINLLFVGDGNERFNLEKIVHDLGIKKYVHFFGASFDENANYELINSSDCCVAPGEVGLTAIHSLTYGVPVISHSNPNFQMPEFESISPGFNGNLFEKDNNSDLKQKIIETIAMKKAKGAIKTREDCYEVVDKYYNPSYQTHLIDNLF